MFNWLYSVVWIFKYYMCLCVDVVGRCEKDLKITFFTGDL